MVEAQWEQILPTLLPSGLAGSVDAVTLCPPVMQEKLEKSELSVVPRNECQEKLKNARVRAEAREWVDIGQPPPCTGTCCSSSREELIGNNGDLLLSDAFGGSKGKKVFREAKKQYVEELRLIVNSIPSNFFQVGNVEILPHFARRRCRSCESGAPRT